jgi:hypothetical protein
MRMQPNASADASELRRLSGNDKRPTPCPREGLHCYRCRKVAWQSVHRAVEALFLQLFRRVIEAQA